MTPASSEDSSAEAATLPSPLSVTPSQESDEQSTTSFDTSDVPGEVLRAGREAVSMYVRLLSEGYGHRWAEMCSLQAPPGVKGTDRAVMQGRYNEEWLNSMPKDQAAAMVREAKGAGINISGKFYMSGLADKRGHCDPAAWIDSAADIRSVARERNLTVRGIVEHQGEPVAPPKAKPLSEKLTREMMAKERALNPGKKMSNGELREKVQAKYGYKRPKA
jgi:hypothetical protein